MNREDAEAHWRYTENIIVLLLELTHVLYVEALLHGAKHGEEAKEKK